MDQYGYRCALCAVLVVCSGLVADFYGEPDLAKVAVVVSAVFVMNGMSTQYRAALNRELRFTRSRYPKLSRWASD
ncbi:oligosaccharide flippase family protein [Rhodococcus hoagii]|nr:oligosaccharide flippase family protein [Prescottella equi]